VYQYEFADNTAPPLPGQENEGPGAKHSTALIFLYRFNGKDPAYWTASQAHLADTMKRYWATFMTNKNPGTAAGVKWPTWKAETHETLRFETNGPTITDNFALQQGCL
jgi:para-nitrobenzyl esterase